jgi:hypothetical protein
MPLNKLVLRIRNICCSTTNLHLQVYVVPNSRKAEEFFFFFFLISKRNIIKKRKAQSSTQEVYKKGI